MASGSRDGKVICFAWKRKDDKWHRVLNGKVAPPGDQITPPAVSEDGKTIAYAIQDGTRWTLTVGGSTSPIETGPHRIFLSSDGRSHGFIMEDRSLPPSEPRRFTVRVGETQGTERFTIIVTPRLLARPNASRPVVPFYFLAGWSFRERGGLPGMVHAQD
jgi:hypothetical protein